MADSRYGNLIVLVGGIQILFAFVMWAGALLYPPSDATWFGAIIETSAFWLVLIWSGGLLLSLGYHIRSDHLQFTNESVSTKVIIYSSAGLAVLGLMAALLILSFYMFG